MATNLTLSGPIGYRAGIQMESGKFLGFYYSSGEINYVLRYSFTTPTSVYITSLTFNTTFRLAINEFPCDAGYTRPIRFKVTTSSTSHINAGKDTTDYDAEYSYYTTEENTPATITIDGLNLSPNTTYYLYLFPGSGYANDASERHGQYMVYLYNNNGNDLSSLAYDESNINTGFVYIDNGTGWDAYAVYIDNGSGWDQYIPYIDNGSSWDACG